MKKIINTPQAFVDEVVEGLLLAHGDQLRSASTDQRALVRTDAGTGGKVGIVTGGGSGHLPLFLGYVGPGLASGVAVGNVFSSPSPAQVYAATSASDAGAGVLYLYGNYGGDVYNFDIAADMARVEGISTTSVVGADDVLSAPADRAETRRGVAGLFFAYKTSGAAADRGDDLDGVTQVAQRTCDRTRTMGVGLSPTILPAAGEPTFSLAEGEMEVGIGIHGEPGQHRGPLESADQITQRFLTELLAELDLAEGDRVAVLVNGLGATPLEELYLIYRYTHQVLTDRGISIHRRYVGEFATSLEMAGASLSILHLDDELAELIDAPACSPFFTQGSIAAPASGSTPTSTPSAQPPPPREPREIRVVADPGPLRALALAALQRMPRHAEELRVLDAALGDGDLGITVSEGATAAHAAITDLPAKAHPSEILTAAGAAFAGANPSTYAALLGGGIVAAAQQLLDAPRFGSSELSTAVRAVQDRIQERGGAQVGDKTVVDVLSPVLAVLERSAGSTPAQVVSAALDAARTAVAEGEDQVSQRGRASWVGARSAGHRDPGSVALLRFLEEVAHEL